MSYHQWLPVHWLFRLWSYWPPFFGAGIKITKVSRDFRDVTITLKLRFWNRNFVGTQYGGSLFSMTDACYMVMLIQNLGPEYIVWDKAATIRYLKPGKTDAYARFVLTDEILNGIRNQLNAQEKMDWITTVQIKDLNDQVIAEVNKVIYVRRKIPKN